MLLRGNMGQFRKGAVARAVLAAIHDAFSSGVLPAAYASINRTGLATRTGPDGRVGYGAHNLVTYSDDISSAAWTKAGAGVTVGQADHLSGSSAERLHAAVSSSPSAYQAGNGTKSILIEAKSAGRDYLWIVDAPGAALAAKFNLTTGVVDYQATGYTAEMYQSGNGYHWCSVRANAGTAFAFVQFGLSDVSGATATCTVSGALGILVDRVLSVVGVLGASQAEATYTPTTTAAVYPPRITYDPTTLACLGMPVEGQASDIAQDTGLNTAVTAAQNRTVTATPWTVQFHGTGTVTLSGAHTAVITGTGLYQQASLTFTPSAGTLTMTPAGDVKNLDLINQAYPSSSIVNTTAGTAVRPADPIVLSGSAFTDRFGDGSDWVMALEFTCPGYVGSGVIAEIAGASDRAVTTGVIFLNAGGVTFSGPGWTAQAGMAFTVPHSTRIRVAIGYSANKMRVSVNGGAVTTDASGTVAGPLGRFALGGNVNLSERQNLIVHDAEFKPGQGSTMSDAALQALSAL